MPLEELTCEEIKARITKMDKREAKEFFDSLPIETRERYTIYVMQRTRQVLDAASNVENYLEV
jgi:hypothetical protein